MYKLIDIMNKNNIAIGQMSVAAIAIVRFYGYGPLPTIVVPQRPGLLVLKLTGSRPPGGYR